MLILGIDFPVADPLPAGWSTGRHGDLTLEVLIAVFGGLVRPSLEQDPSFIVIKVELSNVLPFLFGFASMSTISHLPPLIHENLSDLS